MLSSQAVKSFITITEQLMLKVTFSLLKSDQTVQDHSLPLSLNSLLFFSNPILLVPQAPSGILRDPLRFCLKKSSPLSED